jgi:hypothetical protein
MASEIETMNKIIADIIQFINDKGFYYVPQIFLPALVKQIIVVINYLIKIRDDITLFNVRKNKFYQLINISIPENLKIITLGDEYETFINGELKTIHTNIMDVVKYHNSVIDFLNYHSAFQLLSSSTDASGNYSAKRLFTMNLIPLESFPDMFTGTPNFNLLLEILRLYRIPMMEYYGDGGEVKRLRFEVFIDPREQVPPAVGDDYKFNTYRDVISYERSGKPSYSPVFENLQLNIVATNTGGAKPTYTINDINTSIPGEWISLDTTAPENTTYFDAFIAYSSTKYDNQWVDGMPPSIKKFVGQHLRMLKQLVIEETIQFIVTNREKPDTDPNKKQDLVDLYESIRTLGNETTYTDLDDVKIYVVIGKLMDSLLNKFLEYVIRQSISTWIYEFSTSNYSYRNLADVIAQTIAIIRQKDYLKLSLNEINKKAINELLHLDPKYVDYKLTQIEPNPKNIIYTTQPVPNTFIHYLYDINYFSSNNISTNKKCYQINTNLVSKFITNNTINSKNSDGNTPLHAAIDMNHPELVELLISHGANPKSFTNNHGQSPYDLAISNTQKHINFAYGPKVIDTIENFTIPFNDLLMARLKDEKYGNNIVRDISKGIPIQLVMYNHMFHMYLENYRYGLTINLKNSIWSLFKKYHGFINDHVYPIDLLEIIDRQELLKITQPENISNRIRSAINITNKKKIDHNEKQIKQIDIQLDGLKKEKNQTTDQQQRKFIDDIIVRLESERSLLEADITSLKIEADPIIDTALASAYTSAVNSIESRIERNLSLVEFYNFSFSRVGRTKQLYLSVWDNYFGKNIKNTPSMIFPLINNIVYSLISASREGVINAETKAELTTIVDFYDLVRDYIESKTSYPDNLNENPILKEEFNQIIYLINLIVSPSIRNILLNQIYQGLKEMDGANILLRDQSAILDEIVTIQFNGQTIDSYLYDVLPILAVKYFTTIYGSSDDSDKKITNSSDLFLPFIQIIKTNKIIQVTDNSLLAQNLKEYLIPFMANTYHNFIYHLRLAIYGYERYILNSYQLCKILQSLI